MSLQIVVAGFALLLALVGVAAFPIATLLGLIFVAFELRNEQFGLKTLWVWMLAALGTLVSVSILTWAISVISGAV